MDSEIKEWPLQAQKQDEKHEIEAVKLIGAFSEIDL